MTSAPAQSLLTSGGFSTAYHDIGSGHPVVLLHGSGLGTNAWSSWQRIVPVLKDRFRLILPDFAGYGGSRPPADNFYSIALWTDQIVALLDALGIAQASVGGHSMGGRIVQRLAVVYPDRLARLVLSSSASPKPLDSPVTRGGADPLPPDRERIRARMKGSFYDPSLITDEMVEEKYAASTLPHIKEQADAMFSNGNVVRDSVVSFEALAKVQHRTLILHGREDKVVPVDHGWDLSQTIPNAELHVFPRCGHNSQIEAGDRCNEMIRDHLSRA